MADKLKVRAVDGRTCAHEFSQNFVGWRPSAEGDDVHHVIPLPNGKTLQFTRTDDAVEVPNNVYYRSAIRTGDLEQISDADVRNALTSAPKKKGN